MDHPAIFAEQPFTGMLAAGPSQEAFEFDEAFAGEVGRGRMPARGRAQRAAPRRPPRSATRAAQHRPAQRPPQRQQPRHPRMPRPPMPWPAVGGGYPMPFVAEPFGAPPGSDTWRCVQECLQRGPSGAAPPEAAPADAPPDSAAGASPDSSAGAPSDAPADVPTQEFEFQPPGRGTDSWRGETEAELAPGTMSLATAIADPRSAGAGIYTIYKNGERLYVGRANSLRRRLQQHLWCLTHLKLGPGRFSVKLTPMRGATPAQLGRVEAAVIDRFGRRSQGGQLANVKSREFEQAFE